MYLALEGSWHIGMELFSSVVFLFTDYGFISLIHHLGYVVGRKKGKKKQSRKKNEKKVAAGITAVNLEP